MSRTGIFGFENLKKRTTLQEMSEIAIVMCFLALVVLLILYTMARSASPSGPGVVETPEDNITVLKHELPRHSFIVLYENFPFDVTDVRYRQIKALHDEYAKNVDAFLLLYNRGFEPKVQPDENTMDVTLFKHVHEIETCLKTLYDRMMEYCNIGSERFRTFEEDFEQLHDWFTELRRTYQGQLKQHLTKP